MARSDEISAFSNLINSDFEAAMNTFFERVERKAEAKGLSDEDVNRALLVGYGEEVADEWDEWIEEYRE